MLSRLVAAGRVLCARQAFLSLTPIGRDLYEQCVQSALQFAELLERAMQPARREAFFCCFNEIEQHLRFSASDKKPPMLR
jgi:DNA-binding MarR family transcriptional regulator